MAKQVSQFDAANANSHKNGWMDGDGWKEKVAAVHSCWLDSAVFFVQVLKKATILPAKVWKLSAQV